MHLDIEQMLACMRVRLFLKTCPSTAHHFALDLEPGMRARWIPEPPGFQLHLLAPGTAPVTHTGFIEDFGARPTKP